MVLRVAIVGPGRVGQAVGRRLVQSGVDLLGFVGRRAGGAAAAAAFAGAGRALAGPDLAAAHVLIFCVGDGDLGAAIAGAATGGSRRCQLWLHTSGRFGLEVFDAARAAGVRAASLHPVLPIASASQGAEQLAGALAVAAAEPRARRLVQRLGERLGLQLLWRHGGDAVLYHAACALAANGATALHAVAERVLAAAGGLDGTARALIVDRLMQASLANCRAVGAAAALSGPVRRGDAGTVEAHLEALAASAPDALHLYRAAMGAAVPLAQAAGLDESAAAAVRAALARGT